MALVTVNLVDTFDEWRLKTNSIGAIKDNGVPYLDYPNYIKIKGLEYADKRRKLY